MECKILRTTEEIQQWFLPFNKVYSFDFETTGLDYLKMDPLGVSFCDGSGACYIELTENPGLCKILADIFRGDALWIAHNMKFDYNCCVKFLGVELKNLFCTYIASFLLDENRPDHSLKGLAQEDLHVPFSEIKKFDQVSGMIGSDEWYRYCFNDSIWAFALYQLYCPQLKAEKLDYLFNQVEMPFVPVVSYMERTGIEVDKLKLSELEGRVRKRLIELEDEMLALCGKEPVIQLGFFENERKLPINFRSSQQMIKILEGFGLEVPLNRKKKKSLDQKLIAPLIGKHPFIDLLLEYKTLNKLLTSYITPAWGLIDLDGRIRPSFGIVKTGRMNCRNPNLQCLPRVSKKHPELNYRLIFQAKEGSRLLAPDFSGQELRLLGEVAQDEVIINAFKQGQDLHLLTANRIFGLNLSKEELTEGTPEFQRAKDEYADERYKAKNGANFPIIYGTTAHGISWRLGVPIQEAQKWIDGFFSLYPKVKEAMDGIDSTLRTKGYVTTLFGRRRRFPDYKYFKPPEKARCLRQAFNFMVQGSAADQVKLAAIKAFRSGASIVLMVHDEIIMESTLEQAEQLGEKVKYLMENCISLSLPFKVDYKIAKSYGELK